ncbi:Cys-tRNA(Pro) deacylase [Paraglaciecola hydrolytica]|uniref:Cys-tRNA(Pro)/Cys-tRNA(Cys) deacylase n=1 Tax=Paraglaciecola hydrolytica TaxID=1799789 RepID=A0A135ZYJ8_9ALTE|nr:Cys-tRNA(Pro) deacylase [Paraglaciecola hydrolytica]KXI28059.1 aminoacyl-tRNA deacylase [Paraglaciecola hydrolytica]
MTPAINLLKQAKISHKVHEYQHDAQYESYGLEAAEKLNIEPERVFKTLVVKLDNGQLAVGILPVNQMLSMKAMAKALNAKKAEMADKVAVQRSTGYVLGGVSPLAQKKRLKTVIDQSAQEFVSIFISGGRRGLEIELAATDLAKVTQGQFFSIAV